LHKDHDATTIEATLKWIFSIWYTKYKTHTLNVNNYMKINNNKQKFKHQISTMVICGSYMFEFSVSKDMEKKLTMIKGEFQYIF